MLYYNYQLFREQLSAHYNRYISAIRSQTDQVSEEFAAYIGEMYPVGSCLHVLSDAFVHVCRRFLVGPVSECLEAFVFFERCQACWISRWILRNRQHVLQAGPPPQRGRCRLTGAPGCLFRKTRLPAPGGSSPHAAISSRWITAAFLF